ncbi:phosphoesterase [Clostridium disporicum]|uniref:Phosphoesterase n=1 Tax=Clostridium disporicum TaxID=84024 RepID=A0A173XZ50_9CLOT|nr:DUF1294 domain-containing protein [Clostridium disporicum]MDU6339769.1 DUF1294 domain-containing protein [Clostridium sp.]CUN56137.1 phosphoesterase [Clostridium disporicum]
MIKYFTIYFIIINFVSFILMYIDKRRAIKKEWRISEHTLILISLLGGSIGSLIGMYTFRHKTKHLKFKVGIPIILVIQLLVIANIIR